MCQRSSQGKPCGEMLHEPPTANREKEWEMRGSEQTKERKVGNRWGKNVSFFQIALLCVGMITCIT